MNEPPLCEQVCTPSCAVSCPVAPPRLTLTDALERFRREAVRGVCDTGRYRASYFTWGAGPPLVFLHGVGDSSQTYLGPSALLSRSFRCVAYDLPSGGADGADLKRLTLEGLVADLLALLDHVGARQSYVFGSGFGSTIALAALHAHSESLPRAILHAAVARRRLSLTERLFARLLSHLPGTAGSLPLRRRLLTRTHRASFTDRPSEDWDHFLSFTGAVPTRAVGRRARMVHRIDLLPILPGIRQPILLVNGKSDPSVRPEQSQELLDRLQGAARVILENCGLAPAVTCPELLARVIHLFLTPPTPCPEHDRRVPLADCRASVCPQQETPASTDRSV